MELIYLEKGQQLITDSDKVVCVTGEYTADQLVLVGELNNPIYPPDFPLYQYPAYYIKYGTDHIAE